MFVFGMDCIKNTISTIALCELHKHDSPSESDPLIIPLTANDFCRHVTGYFIAVFNHLSLFLSVSICQRCDEISSALCQYTSVNTNTPRCTIMEFLSGLGIARRTRTFCLSLSAKGYNPCSSIFRYVLKMHRE